MEPPCLFLDFDGVLNGHDYCPKRMSTTLHRDKVELLNWVLEETGAMVVVSSAWRYFLVRNEMNLVGLDWLLRSHGLIANRVVGVTRPDTMERGVYKGHKGTWPVCNERGIQIADYVREHNIQRYAVVDDGGYEDPPHNTIWTDLGIRSAGHPVVFTDGKVGMTRLDAAKLIDILGGKT